MSRDPKCVCGYEEPDQECPIHGEVACLRAIRDDLTDRLLAAERARDEALGELSDAALFLASAERNLTQEMKGTPWHSGLVKMIARARAVLEGGN